MSKITHLRPQEEPQSDFDAFWTAYPAPKRIGKLMARAKFNQIINGGMKTRVLDRDSGRYIEIELSGTAEEIIAGVKKYAASMKKPGQWEFGYAEEGKYILHPSTFLNRGRWLDYE